MFKTGTPWALHAQLPQHPVCYGSCREAILLWPPAWGCILPVSLAWGPAEPHRGPPSSCCPSLQVKELGAVIYNCSRLAQDLEKTFQTYWVLGAPKAVLPKPWPQSFSSHINRFHPFQGQFDGVPTTAYFSVRGVMRPSQPPGCRDPREALLHTTAPAGFSGWGASAVDRAAVCGGEGQAAVGRPSPRKGCQPLLSTGDRWPGRWRGTLWPWDSRNTLFGGVKRLWLLTAEGGENQLFGD